MMLQQNRREFLKTLPPLGAAALGAKPAISSAAPVHQPEQTVLPRWRGFNLLAFFQAFNRYQSSGELQEDDLRWMRDWGFDFVRLPMDYWIWIDSDWRKTRKLAPDDMYRINPAALEKIDKAIELCGKYGLHVNVNFHRAPGYCINNREREPFVLWSDRRAEDAFVFHWGLFAKRYAGISRKQLSFNLLNEAPRPRPGYMTRADYIRVMTRAIKEIRKHSPERLILVDGLSVAHDPIPGMIPLHVAQSMHAYWPAQISHYRAPWVDRNNRFPLPTWPLKDRRGKIIADRAKLEEYVAPWAKLAARGVGVHCGECGCYNKTPYPVFMGWFTAVMDILKEHGIGYALWSFRGSFGILDSGRTDIAYEDWHGHKLDRRLLDLLRSH